MKIYIKKCVITQISFSKEEVDRIVVSNYNNEFFIGTYNRIISVDENVLIKLGRNKPVSFKEFKNSFKEENYTDISFLFKKKYKKANIIKSIAFHLNDENYYLVDIKDDVVFFIEKDLIDKLAKGDISITEEGVVKFENFVYTYFRTPFSRSVIEDLITFIKQI